MLHTRTTSWDQSAAGLYELPRMIKTTFQEGKRARNYLNNEHGEVWGSKMSIKEVVAKREQPQDEY